MITYEEMLEKIPELTIEEYNEAIRKVEQDTFFEIDYSEVNDG